MGGFLNFLGGAGAFAADTTRKQQEAEIERQRLETLHRYQQENNATVNGYEIDKENRQLDPTRNMQLANNEAAKASILTKKSMQDKVDIANDVDSVNAIGTLSVAGEQGAIARQAMENKGRFVSGDAAMAKEQFKYLNEQEDSLNEKLSQPLSIEGRRAVERQLQDIRNQRMQLGTGSSAGVENVGSNYDPLFATHGANFNIDPLMGKAVMVVESNSNPKAVSPTGATGLMQLTKGTARDQGVADRTDPNQNVMGGMKQLSTLYNKTFADMPEDSRKQYSFAAYNAGEGTIKEARKLAIAQGKDPANFDNIKPFIKQAYSNVGPRDKSGNLIGSPDVDYADKVMRQYQTLQTSAPQRPNEPVSTIGNASLKRINEAIDNPDQREVAVQLLRDNPGMEPERSIMLASRAVRGEDGTYTVDGKPVVISPQDTGVADAISAELAKRQQSAVQPEQAQPIGQPDQVAQPSAPTPITQPAIRPDASGTDYQTVKAKLAMVLKQEEANVAKVGSPKPARAGMGIDVSARDKLEHIKELAAQLERVKDHPAGESVRKNILKAIS